jgi:small-conductance mechanosensitive channel
MKQILIEVTLNHKGILNDSRPDVLFDEFDDSSLNFFLRIWTYEFVNKPKVLKSELNYEISRKFSEEGIEIPFPQRDIHIITGGEKLNN